MAIPQFEVVYLLYREISDQMGTDEIIGVYSSSGVAEQWGATITDRRTFVKPILFNARPVKKD